ncbi:MAG: site-2 protease family protein, partial [Phycisphaerae bacterium]
RDDMLVSAAGPGSNLAQAVVFALVVRALGGSGHVLARLDEPLNAMLILAIVINVGLAVFNMLPIWPLDGFHVTSQLLGGASRSWFLQTQRYGMFIIVGLIVMPRLAGGGFDPLGSIIWQPVRYLLKYVAGP